MKTELGSKLGWNKFVVWSRCVAPSLTFMLLLHSQVDLVDTGLNVVPGQVVAALLSGCSLETHQFIHVPEEHTGTTSTSCLGLFHKHTETSDITKNTCHRLLTRVLTSVRIHPPRYWVRWRRWTAASRGRLGHQRPSPGSSAPPTTASPRQRAARGGTASPAGRATNLARMSNGANNMSDQTKRG